MIAEVGFVHNVCQMWDIAMKRCDKSFNLFPRKQTPEETCSALAHGERIIAEAWAADSRPLAWQASDGELVHRLEDPDLAIKSLDADERRAFFGNDSNSISCLEIAMGSAQQGVATWQGRFKLFVSTLAPKNLLFVAHGMELDENDTPEDANNSVGVYVFDVKRGCSQQRFCSGDHDGCR